MTAPAPLDEAPKRRARKEWDGQQAFWTFLNKALPHGTMCRSVDEAAKRSKQANLSRHARGCLGGFGDMYVFWEGVTLWLECKADSGMRISQESFRELIVRNRGHYAKVKTMEDVEAACLAAGIPLRATLGEIRQRIDEQNARLPVKRKRASRPVQTGDRMTMAQYQRVHAKGLL
jgi:hypothetical protein